MKSITFIFLNVSIFLCSFCLEICSAPCHDPQWNHRDASRWTEFRFAILTGKQRREQWKKTTVTFFWCHFCLQPSFHNSYVSAERVMDILGNAEICPSPWNRKTSEKISCGSSTGCWLCLRSAEAQPGKLSGFLGIRVFFFHFFVVSVIARPFEN